ncbi:hypothetical protein J6397_29375 [Rhodococcus qingshengii]|jgi:hypothetical protein|uniref:hypothetical protein n=1 Tax=Rhodococcus TaxID=1827 RepID=UPI0007180262|nr:MULTISPECIES: hypothetical protein [Rhodococcus]MBP1054268.1 hypothetical protein [Rhodococcus qingshengii]MBP2521080.1 hypothetical protein [Rhodococcus sp. PvP104]MDA3637772.1 hypothetical protein [Rhodococcus sp. C-2]MYV31834.1 hypothetical protein [Rhodococcus erythropolis]
MTNDTHTASTAAERRKERREIDKRARKLSKRTAEFRRTYIGLTDLDVPTSREVVERYTVLRDSGRLPADSDEIAGTITWVRRWHESDVNVLYAAVAMVLGLTGTVMSLSLMNWGTSLSSLSGADLARDALVAAVGGAIVATLFWGARLRQVSETSAVFRAHADALLTQVENADPAANV